jgi:serine/threonine protein kinase
LKVFRGGDLVAQGAHLLQVSRELRQVSHDQAFAAANHICLQAGVDDDLLAEHPALEAAIVMPWIEGEVWADIVQRREPMRLGSSLALAGELARALRLLEMRELAHCDLSSRNVIVGQTPGEIDLIDFDTLFSPHLDTYDNIVYFSPGYFRPGMQRWGPMCDRFSGAILLVEMACWHDARVRETAESFSYFDPEDDLTGRDHPKYLRLRAVLADMHAGLAELLQAAWDADGLGDCPTFGQWHEVIQRAQDGFLSSRASGLPDGSRRGRR